VDEFDALGDVEELSPLLEWERDREITPDEVQTEAIAVFDRLAARFGLNGDFERTLLSESTVDYKVSFIRTANRCRDAGEWGRVLGALALGGDASYMRLIGSRIQHLRRRDYEHLLAALNETANREHFNRPLELVAANVALFDKEFRDLFTSAIRRCAGDTMFWGALRGRFFGDNVIHVTNTWRTSTVDTLQRGLASCTAQVDLTA
jgi:hypothetical protein